jgi:phosphopantothenate synthetase
MQRTLHAVFFSARNQGFRNIFFRSDASVSLVDEMIRRLAGTLKKLKKTMQEVNEEEADNLTPPYKDQRQP